MSIFDDEDDDGKQEDARQGIVEKEWNSILNTSIPADIKNDPTLISMFRTLFYSGWYASWTMRNVMAENHEDEEMDAVMDRAYDLIEEELERFVSGVVEKSASDKSKMN